MKNIIIILAFISLIPFSIASAASFVVSPASGNYTTGENITLNISVNPEGTTIYTAVFDAEFSNTNLDVISFKMNDSMLAMKQPGYDEVDNTNGLLIKTGGYTGGINNTTPFGTLVLKTKGVGIGEFSITSSSKLLDSNNDNKNSKTPTFNFNISEKVVAVVEEAVKDVVDEAQPVVITEVTQTIEETAKEDGPEQLDEEMDSQDDNVYPSQLASVGQSESFNSILLWIVGLILAFVIGYWCGFKKLFYKG